ncbi:MAG: beta-glucosidase BglX [Bacteroides intestinalis]|nr:beta-glucosidase BglX [Bacteroides intestinalis]
MAQQMPADKEARMEKFITELMSKMTLEEKIGQLHQISGGDVVSGELSSDGNKTAQQIRSGGVGSMLNAKGVEKVCALQKVAVEQSRLKIPLLFGMDVIHGYETAFPVPLAMASTWNMKQIETMARTAAVETSADGVCWTFSPMVDITRDPRWGRIVEGAGEDPFLGGAVAKAMVKGYQGEPGFATNTQILACVKHFALYGAPDAGRDYSTVDMSRLRMFNDYLYPYQAAVEAGVATVMSSFNEVDNVPATANKWLLEDLLRKQWGFKGLVLTDYASINDLPRHGIGDPVSTTIRALEAGTDIDMKAYAYHYMLPEAVRNGRVPMALIDKACRRVLEAKYQLGLFKNPYKYCDVTRPAKEFFTKENRAKSRQAAGESFVLLKNDSITLNPAVPAKPLLLLAKQGTIAVIGPHGNNRPMMLGPWFYPHDIQRAATVVEGLKEAVGSKAKVVFARGCQPFESEEYAQRVYFGKEFERDNRPDTEILAEALNVAKNADVIIATLGESTEMSGESSSRSILDLPKPQQDLLKALAETGKPIVLVLFTGRPLTINWEKANLPAILNVWFPGTEAAYAIADVLFGDVNPSGKLTATWPQSVGQIPIYYNGKNTGKPMDKWFQKFRSGYLDVSNEPLYPFGYGLSYTNFEYSDVILNDSVMSPKGQLTASVTVKNTGKRDGYEVVQLYICDKAASIIRPLKELKGFQKVFIKAGQSVKVDFQITSDLLKFYNSDLEYVCEPGDFDAMIGCNSVELKSAKFTLVE